MKLDVASPAPGRWTAIIFSRQAGNTGGTAGRILFQASSRPGPGAAGYGQVQYYAFTVPSGQPDVSAEMALADDPANLVDGYLVNPDGQLMGYG